MGKRWRVRRWEGERVRAWGVAATEGDWGLGTGVWTKGPLVRLPSAAQEKLCWQK